MPDFGTNKAIKEWHIASEHAMHMVSSVWLESMLGISLWIEFVK